MIQSPLNNRLLASLPDDDFAELRPKLQRVALCLHDEIIRAYRPIEHVFFIERGIASIVANTTEGRIEIGVVGREGLVGVPVLLGADRTPHSSMIQSAGEALRISAGDLRTAIALRPSIFRPLGLYVQALIVQMAQTTYAHATLNLRARLARWILMTQDRVGGDDLVLTHEFLAAMLGVRRAGVTVATHVLEGMGLIRATRGRIVVRNREKLLEIAGDAYQVAEDEYARLMAEV